MLLSGRLYHFSVSQLKVNGSIWLNKDFLCYAAKQVVVEVGNQGLIGQPFLYKLSHLLRSTAFADFVFRFGTIHDKLEQLIRISAGIGHLSVNFIIQPEDFDG